MSEAEISQVGAAEPEALEAAREPIYASFWRRTIAAVIDGLIVGVPFAIGVYMLFPDQVITEVQDPPMPGRTYLISLALYVLAVVGYMAGMESSARQATIGKQVMGIQVTDLSLARISFFRAVRRGWFYWLPMALILIDSVGQVMVFALISLIVALVSCVAVAFTEQRQALHDISAGCLLIERPPAKD